MSATNLPFIQREMIRYGITTYFVLGIMGNICNCIMFTRPASRRAPSSIYLLSLSILAIIYLSWSFTHQIFAFNYIDLDTTSLLFCKVRLYISLILGQGTRYAIVLICADRFFVTRTNVRFRSFNTAQFARKLVFIKILMISLAAIHLPFFMEIRGGICGTFGLYKLIYAIYQMIIAAILPPVLMIIFSALTILSLNQRHGTRVHARQRDRHLLRMVIAEVIVNIVTSIPYSCNVMYGAITYSVTNKSTYRREVESFITFFTQFLIYLISVTPFYLFIITSKSFRNDFVKLINFWGKCTLRRFRIVPLNEQNITAAVNHPTTRGK